MLLKCNKYLKHTMYIYTYICLHAHAQAHMHKCICVHTGTHICSLIGLALAVLETENSCIICWQLQWEGGRNMFIILLMTVYCNHLRVQECWLTANGILTVFQV